MHFLIKKPVIWFFPALFALMFIFSIVKYSYLESELSAQIAAYGILAIFIICFILELIPQYISPHIVMLISYISGYDLIIATLIVLIGSLLGSSISFGLGRYYGEDIMMDLISGKKLGKLERAFNKRGRIYVAAAAISPLPFIPIAFGALGLTRRNFLYFGLFPRAAGFILLSIFLSLVF